jgi:hypothetical protein
MSDGGQGSFDFAHGGPNAMERLLKLFDDVDDFCAVARLQAGPLAVTLALLVVFLAAVGAVFLLGPPDLYASP